MWVRHKTNRACLLLRMQKLAFGWFTKYCALSPSLCFSSKYTVSLALWQVQDFLGKENRDKIRKKKKKNVFLNVQPEYKESWIYALLHLKKHLSLKHSATAYHATPCYVIGSKSFRPDIQNRAKWKMLWGIYSAIYGEVNVSVEKCAEIKGDYVEK